MSRQHSGAADDDDQAGKPQDIVCSGGIKIDLGSGNRPKQQNGDNDRDHS